MLVRGTSLILVLSVWFLSQDTFLVSPFFSVDSMSAGRGLLHSANEYDIPEISNNNEEFSVVNFSKRKILNSECSCPTLPDWVKYKGGAILFVLGILYTFLGLAIVCDEFFVASLEIISERLQLSEDVAGATFMAAGSSAPELFTSLTALFNPGTSDSMGTAAIVGSAVFNVLVIIGITGMFAGRTLHLDWKPLCRDGFFYAACIILLLIFFEDGKVELYESVLFVVGYFSYVTFMKFNSSIFDWADKVVGNRVTPESSSPARTPSGKVLVRQLSKQISRENSKKMRASCEQETSMTHLSSPSSQHKDRSLPPLDVPAPSVPSSKTQLPLFPPNLPSPNPLPENPVDGKNAPASAKADDDDDNACNVFAWPSDDGPIDKILWIWSQPYHYMFWLTIPDCRVERFKEWYMGSFLMSIAWIAGLSYFMVDWTNAVGCVIGMPPVAMGVTVLAAGTSIPDALGSLAVAKAGQGDMAVANAIGSNVFDILLGLGLPWLITIILRGESIEVAKGDLFSNIAFLFAVLIIYFSLLFLNKLKLTRGVGIILCSIYGCFVIYTIVFNFVSSSSDCK